MTLRPDPGLRVDPIRIGGRRSSAPIVALTLATAFICLAVVKPWSSAPLPAPAAISGAIESAASSATLARPAPSPSAGATALPSRPVARPTPADIDDWTALANDLDRLAGQPLVSDRDIGGTDGDGTCGGSARISPFDDRIGIVAPAGQRITRVRLVPIDTLRRADVTVRIAPDVVAGVTVIALPPGGIAAGQYSLIADTGRWPDGRLTYTICVG